jgi:hypothetical protein
MDAKSGIAASRSGGTCGGRRAAQRRIEVSDEYEGRDVAPEREGRTTEQLGAAKPSEGDAGVVAETLSEKIFSELSSDHKLHFDAEARFLHQASIWRIIEDAIKERDAALIAKTREVFHQHHVHCSCFASKPVGSPGCSCVLLMSQEFDEQRAAVRAATEAATRLDEALKWRDRFDPEHTDHASGSDIATLIAALRAAPIERPAEGGE